MLFILVHQALALFCQPEDCYELLGVGREDSPQLVAKAYRRLALLYHPDRYPQHRDRFALINNAYQILLEYRKQYQEYLKTRSTLSVLKYYRKRYQPRWALHEVLCVLALLLTLAQFLIRRQMHLRAKARLAESEEVSKEAKRLKAERPESSEEELRREICEEIEIVGGQAYPKLRELLLVRLFMLPFTLSYSLFFRIRLFIRQRRNAPLDEQDRKFLTISRLGLRESHWEFLTQEQREWLLSQAVWTKEGEERLRREEEERRGRQRRQTRKAKLR